MFKPAEMNEKKIDTRKSTCGDYLNWREFACGWGAAFINVTITYPVNKIIFRQMLHGVRTTDAFFQLKNEGISYLYRGMLPPLCQKTLSLSLMFGVYEEVRKPLCENGVNPYIAKALGALLSGTTEAILMPFERIQTLMADSTYHKKFRNTFHAFRFVKGYGVGEYYRGLVPILFRNGPSNVGFFIIREEMQEKLPKYETELLRTTTEFLCGALIGVFLSSLFYPLNVLKVQMQSKIGGPYENPLQVLGNIYRERGCRISKMYYGVGTNCFRAMLSWGVMNTAYEHIKDHIY
ncbi:unnamed protein product [Brassicogethes aeneus]|uniref:Solute carrier family 25 member 51 n=1 Tax=Brassicogethes aeneus TaxID=1431903 RepID=A0A9P0FK47_BRAAE|nr:unnamed protein product [Brassicogethes aeneus]